ncbi:MAG: FadR/GntR family transcriptional regulator [Gammaproteobacteria bacterium]|nr:FadR/GntR family transcriptional regulator [Gammaproteobacteria bacterium]
MKGQKLYESVAQRIARRLEKGVYPPGTRLPGERELAEQFNVSRVTIRQALISLQALGRLEVRAGSGAHVLDAAVSQVDVLPKASALELTEARSLFESEVAALAAPDISDETLAELERLIEEMSSDDHENPDEAELADRDFHLTIAAAAGNSVLYYIVEKLWRMRMELAPVKKVYDSVCSDDAAARGGEHREILDALHSRDPVQARLAMRKHFTRLLESMLDVTEQNALRDVRRKASESRERFLKSARI